MARYFEMTRRPFRIYAEEVEAQIKALGVVVEDVREVSVKLGVSWEEAALLLSDCEPRAIAAL